MHMDKTNRLRPLHKVVLLGDSRVGKTSIISRQTQLFDGSSPTPTVGCHCSEIAITLNDKIVTLQVWDTAGQEMYRALVHVYLRGADGALVVYDITDKESFASLPQWFSLIDDTLPPETVIFLIANKLDLIENSVVPEDNGRACAASHRATFFNTSAVTGRGIDEIFVAMAKEIIRRVRTDHDSRRMSAVEQKDLDGGCDC
jgi:small GTP-binding protein